jgi:broad specificity phosphatase PhoE
MASSHKQSIWLCRHGERIDFVDPSWPDKDPHLSPKGVIQAQETGMRLRGEPIAHIFCSPFLRTLETAHHIAQALDLPIKIEHGACEWLNPEWFDEPVTYWSGEKLLQRFPRVDLSYTSMVLPTFPEPSREVIRERCRQTITRLVNHYSSDLLIIGHGASVLGIAKALLGPQQDISTGLCSLTQIHWHNQQATMALNGDTSHLSEGNLFADRLI